MVFLGEKSEALPPIACASCPGENTFSAPFSPLPERPDYSDFGVNDEAQVLHFPPVANACLVILIVMLGAIVTVSVAAPTINIIIPKVNPSDISFRKCSI